MQRNRCGQCKKLFDNPSFRKYCSIACRESGKKERDSRSKIKFSASLPKRKPFFRPDDFDPSTLKIGDYIDFESDQGVIVAVFHCGTSIEDAVQRLIDIYPDFGYAKLLAVPSSFPVTTTRYIVKTENSRGVFLRWPYLYKIRGFVDEKAENSETEKAIES